MTTDVALACVFEFLDENDALRVARFLCPEQAWSVAEQTQTFYSFLDTADDELQQYGQTLFLETARVGSNVDPRHRLHFRGHADFIPKFSQSCDPPSVFSAIPWASAPPADLELFIADAALYPAVVAALPLVGVCLPADAVLQLSGRMQLWTIAHTYRYNGAPACTIEVTRTAKLGANGEIEKLAPRWALVIGSVNEASEAIDEATRRARHYAIATDTNYRMIRFNGYDSAYTTWWHADYDSGEENYEEFRRATGDEAHRTSDDGGSLVDDVGAFLFDSSVDDQP